MFFAGESEFLEVFGGNEVILVDFENFLIGFFGEGFFTGF